MDSITLEQLGYQPIKANLDRIAACERCKWLTKRNGRATFERSRRHMARNRVNADRKNVTQYIPQIGQGGTTLPDRDYYLKNDARSTTIRKEYNQHLINMFQLVGKSASEASRASDAVQRIETALSKAQYARVRTERSLQNI
jgi:putative endopeptidase